jgi:hypothetical protein
MSCESLLTKNHVPDMRFTEVHSGPWPALRDIENMLAKYPTQIGNRFFVSKLSHDISHGQRA